MTNKSKPIPGTFVKGEVLELTAPAVTTPMDLLQMAISSNANMDTLERLKKMQDEWEAKEAKKAFFEALSGFQNDCPEIKKVRKVDYAPKDTGKARVKYNFASLGDIEKQIKGPMMKHGLSKRFELREEGVPLQIILTCKITHKLGHTESTTISGGLDESGGKSPIHAKGSIIAYLERYALLASLGIATADTDDDGQAAGGKNQDGNDLPFFTEAGYKEAMQKVIRGELTVEGILKGRQLKPEQKDALEAAEKAVKKG